MQVGIDFTPVIYHRGVSRYTHNLIMSLADKKNIELQLYASSFRQKEQLQQYLQKHQLNTKPHSIQAYPPSLLSWLWRFGLNSVSSQLHNIAVFHSWDWLQPPDSDLPLVSTIHDLAIIRFPETAHPQIRAMHERSWKILRDREAQVIAVSQATKQDIVRYLEIPAHRVHVVYEALPQETVELSQQISQETVELITQNLELNQKYILFVGTREPRKNIMRLIEAWQPLANEYQLLVAGEPGWDGSEEVQRKVPSNRLRFLGKVSDEELHVLYAEAELLAYPSLYEGFGLPILEAFHHGTPVLTSNTSSMPEVAGNAAELVDPLSVESIRAGMETLLNETAQEQKTRLQKMVIRLHSFSWKRVADETVQVYQHAIAEKTED